MYRKEKGQGLVEYGALLLFVVVVVALVVDYLTLPIIWFPYWSIICSMDDSFPECDCLDEEDFIVCLEEIEETSILNTQTTFSAEGLPIENPELDGVLEKIEILMEQAVLQEEMLGESVNLTGEAFVESLEVLTEYTGETGNQLLFDSLSQLKDEIVAGNFEAFIEDVLLVQDALTGTPHDVIVKYIMKMTPPYIEACQVISDGIVTNEAISETQFAVEHLDDNTPGKTEALGYLNEFVGIIENRNTLIEQAVGVHSYLIDFFIAYLVSSGEEDLAAQLTAESEVCSIP